MTKVFQLLSPEEILGLDQLYGPVWEYYVGYMRKLANQYVETKDDALRSELILEWQKTLVSVAKDGKLTTANGLPSELVYRIRRVEKQAIDEWKTAAEILLLDK